MYRIDSDAVIIGDVCAKKTSDTPRHVIDVCKQRLARYDKATVKLFRQIDQDDIGILPRAIEDDVFPVRCDVERP
jgi:hypothetical protein